MLQSVWRPAFRPVMSSPLETAAGGGPSLTEQIRKLFANGEQGGMWDFTSPEGMYQDATGTTPVTAVGQSVGLMLDRRFGLERGPELVPSGAFDSAAGWRPETGNPVSGGSAVFVSSTSTAALFRPLPLSTTTGTYYEITFRIVSSSAGTIGIRLASVGGSPPAMYSSPGTYTYRIAVGAAAPSNTNVVFQTSGFSGTVDFLSVREVPGNHLTQSTTAARPTFTADGALHDGVDDFLMAANEEDWTFLHDGSGGTLGICMRWEGYGGSGRKLTGTHGSSDTSSRAMSVGYYTTGIRTLVGRGESGLVQALTEVTPDPSSLFTAIGTLDTDEVACWVDGSRYANTVDWPLSQDPASNPLRTIVSPNNGEVSYFRRMLAINRVLTNTELALVRSWFMEGVE